MNKAYQRAEINHSGEWYVVTLLMFRGIEDSEHIIQLYAKQHNDAFIIATQLAMVVFDRTPS